MTGIRIFGEPGSYHGSYHDDGSHNGYMLRECPFCGGDALTICNTHSPTFWIECECGAQMSGEYIDAGDTAPNEAAALVEFEKAMASVVADWNTREN